MIEIPTSLNKKVSYCPFLQMKRQIETPPHPVASTSKKAKSEGGEVDRKEEEDVATKKRQMLELEYHILSLLKCPVCTDNVRDIDIETKCVSLQQCINGHIVCTKCLNQMRVQGSTPNCPVCRVSWTLARNLFADRVLTTYFKFEKSGCDFAKYGCKAYGVLADIKVHEARCIFRDVRCPARYFQNCTWSGSLMKLMDHLKETNHVTLSRVLKYSMGEEVAKCSIATFRGRYSNTPPSYFRLTVNKTFKPLAILSPGLCRAFLSFHIDRSNAGRWTFGVWAQLEEDCCKGVVAHVAICAPTKRSYAAQLPVLPALSWNREDAVTRGGVLILFDEMIKLRDDQDVAFDFAVRIVSTQKFRAGITSQNTADENSRIELQLMGEIVPDKLQLPQPQVAEIGERSSGPAEHVSPSYSPVSPPPGPEQGSLGLQVEHPRPPDSHV